MPMERTLVEGLFDVGNCRMTRLYMIYSIYDISIIYIYIYIFDIENKTCTKHMISKTHMQQLEVEPDFNVNFLTKQKRRLTARARDPDSSKCQFRHNNFLLMAGQPTPALTYLPQK